jgi:hypothetical protein
LVDLAHLAVERALFGPQLRLHLLHPLCIDDRFREEYGGGEWLSAASVVGVMRAFRATYLLVMVQK